MKYVCATMSLKASVPPFIVAARDYNSSCVTILSHVAQLLGPPSAVLKAEAHAVMSLLGTPYNSIVPKLVCHFKTLGMPCGFRSVEHLSLASRARVCMRFKSDLDQLAREMQDLDDFHDVRHERLLHPRVRRGTALSLQHRWWGILSVTLQKAVARALSGQTTASENNSQRMRSSDNPLYVAKLSSQCFLPCWVLSRFKSFGNRR